jgi:hypothetical protein
VADREEISRDFHAFLNRVGTGTSQGRADREALFRQFLEWREQQNLQQRDRQRGRR